MRFAFTGLRENNIRVANRTDSHVITRLGTANCASGSGIVFTILMRVEFEVNDRLNHKKEINMWCLIL